MKFLSALILGLVGSAGMVHAAEIVPFESLSCTTDINSWGQSSRCDCPADTRYDLRIGYCVRGEDNSITVSGSIVANLVAIGGETTGLALQTFAEPRKIYELVVQQKDFQKLSKLNGMPFEVVGDYVELPGVERGPRPAIIVKELHWLD